MGTCGGGKGVRKGVSHGRVVKKGFQGGFTSPRSFWGGDGGSSKRGERDEWGSTRQKILKSRGQQIEN